MPVLELDWDSLCRNCSRAVELDPMHEAALGAVATLSVMRAQTVTLENELGDDSRRWSWLDYARHRAAHPIDTAGAADLSAPMRQQKGWARTCAALNRLAMEFSSRLDDMLADLARRLGTGEVDEGLLDRSVAAVSADPAVHDESDLLQRITLARADAGYLTGSAPFNAFGYTAALWRRARHAGTDQAAIAAQITTALAESLPRVRDLTALPDDDTAPLPCDCPHSFADRVLAHLRERIAARWIQSLESELSDLLRDYTTSDTEQVLLVPRWPLTTDVDARLAFLTQYPPVVEPVEVRLRGGWNDTMTRVAVLRVPVAAAEQAAAVTSTVHRAALENGATPESVGVELLRARCGLVVHSVDVPERETPSALVESERKLLDAVLGDTSPYGPYRPFRPGAEPPPRLHSDSRKWESWIARGAFTDRAVFVVGVDDLQLLALARDYDGVAVQIRIEVPAGAYAGSRVLHAWQPVPPPSRPPTDLESGMADIAAVLYQVDTQRDRVQLAVDPVLDRIWVPLTYIALIQADR